MTIQDQEFGELVGLIKALKESSMERHLETHEALAKGDTKLVQSVMEQIVKETPQVLSGQIQQSNQQQ